MATVVNSTTSLRSWIEQLRRPPDVSPWRDATAVLSILLLVTIFTYMLDERTLYDVSVWSKPIKFQASLALHFATMLILIRFLDERASRSLWLRFMIPASAFAAIGEIAWIMIQAARAEPSHFNRSTEFEGAMYGLMGLGAFLLVLAPLVLGILILRSRPAENAIVQLAAGVGLIISAVATLIVAQYMAAGDGHWVGDVGSDAGGLPIVGWVQQGGDLRVPHFFATHAMQFLPLLALILPLSLRRKSVVYGAAGIYVAFVAFVFVQALQGRPFLQM